MKFFNQNTLARLTVTATFLLFMTACQFEDIGGNTTSPVQDETPVDTSSTTPDETTGDTASTEQDETTTLAHYAVISTQASDFSSGDISIISLQDYSADNVNFSGGSDTAISTNGENFYRIGRYQQDNITKFSINDPENNIWQYSANGEGEESTNPYKLVVKNDTTAYLIRYGHAKVWIIDPSAETTETFKTGEIDLSAYAGDDNIPEVTDALLIDNKLYLLIQNLDRDAGWVPGQAYLAIFDTSDDTEVETNSEAATPKGVALKTKNPQKMNIVEGGSTIYIASVGRYGSSYSQRAPEFTGGIESVNMTTYDTAIVIDDGDDTTHPYGNINDIAVLNDSRGYFVGYTAYMDTALYSFNPSTMEVDATPLMVNKDISDIEIGPLGNLWIANRGESGITIIDTVDNSVLKELIDTDLVPYDIEFISVPQTN